MTRFKVEWTQSASQDLQEIVSYIAQDSVEVAERLLERLKQRTSTLAHFAERGRLVPELTRFAVRRYRELVVRPYRILYRIEGRRVFVLGVFDGRRDLGEVILQRLLRG